MVIMPATTSNVKILTGRPFTVPDLASFGSIGMGFMLKILLSADWTIPGFFAHEGSGGVIPARLPTLTGFNVLFDCTTQAIFLDSEQGRTQTSTYVRRCRLSSRTMGLSLRRHSRESGKRLGSIHRANANGRS